MKIPSLKDIVDGMKTVVYKEPSAMLNPPEEYKKMPATIKQLNPNTRIINRGK